MSRLFLAKLAPRRMLHLPSRTVRLRLTLLYSGLFLVSGVALLAATYLAFRSNSRIDLIVPTGNRALHKISQNPAVVRRCAKCTRHPLHVTATVSTRDLFSPGSRSRL